MGSPRKNLLSPQMRQLIGLMFTPLALTLAVLAMTYYLYSPESFFLFEKNFTLIAFAPVYDPLTVYWCDTVVTFGFALFAVFLTGSPLAGSILFLGFYLANMVKIYVLREHFVHHDFFLIQELWEGVGHGGHLLLLVLALLLLWCLRVSLSLRFVKIRVCVVVGLVAVAGYYLKNAQALLKKFESEVTVQALERDPYAMAMYSGPMMAIALYELKYQGLVSVLKDANTYPATSPVFDFRSVPLEMIKHKPNIYIFMLESYLDPYYFHKIPYNVPPISGMLAEEIKGQEASVFYTIRSTAAAEFEVLCGIPNQQAYTSKVFNLLIDKSRKLDCLPQILKRFGYTSIASHPNAASMYNRGNAYPIIGFDKVVFAPDLDMSDKDAVWLNDRSFLQQNLQMVKAQLKTGKPFLNYVMTVGGHFPYELAPQRSAKLDLTKFPKTLAAKALQLSYYTASAVNEYVETLRAIDPDALVVIMGDHFPYVINEDDGLLKWQNTQNALPTPSYTPKHTLYNLEHQTFGMMLHRSHRLPLHNFEQFDVANLLVDSMTEGQWCKEHECMQNKPYMLIGTDIVDRTNPATLYCGTKASIQQESVTKQGQCEQAQVLKDMYLLQYQQMLHAFFQ